MTDFFLKSEKILLRAPELNDATRTASLANNFNIWINVKDIFSHPYKLDDAKFFINLCKQEKVPATFAIIFKNELVGFTGFTLLDDIYKNTAEFGFWIGEPYWNKGIATEATHLMLKYGFETLHLRRIHAGVFDYNKASARVLEKCGFSMEAIHKKAVCKNQVICDEIKYVIFNTNV